MKYLILSLFTFIGLSSCKVEKEGEFNMVSMKDIFLESGLLKASFTFLTAKKDDEADFTYQDSFNETYCLKYNCETDRYNVFWCERNSVKFPKKVKMKTVIILLPLLTFSLSDMNKEG